MAEQNGNIASAAGPIDLGGDLTVNRLGFGAMRTDYLNRFQSSGWPLVIGEFGRQFASSEVDDQTLMSGSPIATRRAAPSA